MTDVKTQRRRSLGGFAGLLGTTGLTGDGLFGGGRDTRFGALASTAYRNPGAVDLDARLRDGAWHRASS